MSRCWLLFICLLQLFVFGFLVGKAESVEHNDVLGKFCCNVCLDNTSSIVINARWLKSAIAFYDKQSKGKIGAWLPYSIRKKLIQLRRQPKNAAKLKSISLELCRRLNLCQINECNIENKTGYTQDFEIDVRFSGRGQRRRRIVPPPFDQGVCGACWAVSASIVHSSVIAETRGTEQQMYSPQYLVDCAPKGGRDGCQGQPPEHAYDRLRDTGIPLEQLYPYDEKAKKSGVCGARAANAIELTKQQGLLYKAKKYGKFENGIEMEAYIRQHRLPISAVFDAPDSFSLWKTADVYEPTLAECDEAKLNGTLHAITLVGIGEIGGKKYWLVQNSFWDEKGTQWGIDNLGKFIRGTDSCGIESAGMWELEVEKVKP